jgi:hypothetical protein
MSKGSAKISFKPKQVTKNLLSVLPDRGKDIIISRYGLGNETKRMTLDSIGKKYGITRERVRQIENYSIANIRKSKEYEKEKKVFSELEEAVHSFGGIVTEQDFLDGISKDKSIQNHIHFLLVVGDPFMKEKEDKEFKHRWYVDKKLADKIHSSLRKIYSNLSDEDLISESEMIKSFLENLKDVSDKYKDEEIIKRWLSISKHIDKNPLGEWGKASSPNIKAKGIRDYAFLVIRRHGSPIHFREVAKHIEDVFNKKAHVATTHNELIKDPRFVLVGRGLYALVDWGYSTGVVKDVIRDIIEKEGPLSKEDIVDKVLKERYVKENTILVNLQNPKFFKKTKEGKYTVA